MSRKGKWRWNLIELGSFLSCESHVVICESQPYPRAAEALSPHLHNKAATGPLVGAQTVTTPTSVQAFKQLQLHHHPWSRPKQQNSSQSNDTKQATVVTS